MGSSHVRTIDDTSVQGANSDWFLGAASDMKDIIFPPKSTCAPLSMNSDLRAATETALQLATALVRLYCRTLDAWQYFDHLEPAAT